MAPDERDPAPDADRPRVVAPFAVTCPRCGETDHPVNNCCPWCAAWLIGARPVSAPEYDEGEPEDDWDTELARRDDAPPPPIGTVFHPGWVVGVSYALLIGSLVVFLMAVVVGGVRSKEELYTGLAIVEIADALLTVVALALVWRAARQPVPPGTRLLTWGIAVPVLFALLCLNIAYITFLRELFRPLGAPQPERVELTLVTVMLICVQPAIVEELFFRQMVLGVFRRSLNLHAAVWVTAALFAFAHITKPIGMPYLFIGGAVFGYARAFGGLSLAMVMHFIHNFAVIAYEAWK
ncbi:MAG: CPBP family intramembrane metalloprotease [Planctomycetes bacterium]|nr:CPBP family intramembrane metalloprotease [Planctomycetota bacterium]